MHVPGMLMAKAAECRGRPLATARAAWLIHLDIETGHSRQQEYPSLQLGSPLMCCPSRMLGSGTAEPAAGLAALLRSSIPS